MTNHLLLMSDLQPWTTYSFRVTSVDASSNSATSPAAPAQPASCESGRLDCGIDDLAVDFAAGLRSATVTEGLLVVNGTLFGTDAYFAPGRALEFVATFGAEAYQHVGFGTDLNTLPLILFSTGTSTTTLFARTWDAANVDGTLVATHAGIAADLRPVMSDLTVGAPRSRSTGCASAPSHTAHRSSRTSSMPASNRAGKT